MSRWRVVGFGSGSDDDFVCGGVGGEGVEGFVVVVEVNRWVMIPSVRTRPVRRAAMAAPKEVLSAKDPLMVISRRKTSNGWICTMSSALGDAVDQDGAAVAGQRDADFDRRLFEPVASTTMS